MANVKYLSYDGLTHYTEKINNKFEAAEKSIISITNLLSDLQESINTHTHTQYAPTSHTHAYLPLSGGALTGPLVFNGNDTDRNIIRINNGTGDATTKSYYGFTLKYLGSGSGNDNALALYSDNITATSQIQIAKWLQNGTLNSRSILPISNNTYSLGSASYKWANVYATTFTGNLTGNVTGNASSSTKTGDGTNILYAEKNNEINFGGTAVSDTIYFGYRAADSKSIPSKFVFGGINGTAELLAKTYKKTDGTEVAYVSNSFIIKRDITDSLTQAQITSYADLSTSSPQQSAFKLLKSGSYNVVRSGSSELLINLGVNTGSTSALEFLTNYTHTSRLKVRKVIDSNRVSGEFKELAWYSDIPTIPASLKNPYSLTIQGNGTTLTNGVYDGSAAKTVNITPASIGAAPTSHTHAYAGSDSVGGPANKVKITDGDNDTERKLLVTDGSNGVYSVPNVTANYNKGSITAKTIKATDSVVVGSSYIQYNSSTGCLEIIA